MTLLSIIGLALSGAGLLCTTLGNSAEMKKEVMETVDDYLREDEEDDENEDEEEES